MLSITKCKNILEDDGVSKYTDEEVSQIREFLYNAARMVIETTQKTSEDAA
jgi:hypothetical protein